MNTGTRKSVGPWSRRLVLALLLSVVALGVAPAGAQDTTSDPGQGSSTSFGFTVEPYNETAAQRRDALQYQMSPDETLADRVSIVNNSDTEKDLYLYAADAVNSTVGGGFALKQRTDPAVDAASWVSLPANRYTVPARSAAVVPIQITVPPDAEPGDHAAAVVAEEVTGPDASSTPGVLTVRRVGTRLYIRVTGPATPSLQVQAVSVTNTNPVAPWKAGSATVTYTIANTGNTRLRIDEIEVKVSGPLGLGGTTVTRQRTEEDAQGLPDALLPGNQAVFTDQVDDVRSLGLMTASVNVTGEDPVLQTQVSTSSSTTFWQVPWVILGLLVLVVIAVVVWRWRRRAMPPSEPATVREGASV